MALLPTSGDTGFFPSNTDLMLEAFERIQIRPSEIVQEHIFSGRMTANLILLDWNTRGVNLWTIDRPSFVMSQGAPTYSLPADTIQVLESVRQTTNSQGQTEEIVLTPLSVTDYNAIPYKAQQAPPTSYWYNRQSPIPTITFWPVADQNGPYTFLYYRMRQIQGANMVGVERVDLPNRFLMAFVAEWAAELSVKWRPERTQDLAALAKMRWDLASNDDSEKVSTFMRPDFSSYMR